MICAREGPVPEDVGEHAGGPGRGFARLSTVSREGPGNLRSKPNRSADRCGNAGSASGEGLFLRPLRLSGSCGFPWFLVLRDGGIKRWDRESLCATVLL